MKREVCLHGNLVPHPSSQHLLINTVSSHENQPRIERRLFILLLCEYVSIFPTFPRALLLWGNFAVIDVERSERERERKREKERDRGSERE